MKTRWTLCSDGDEIQLTIDNRRYIYLSDSCPLGMKLDYTEHFEEVYINYFPLELANLVGCTSAAEGKRYFSFLVVEEDAN